MTSNTPGSDDGRHLPRDRHRPSGPGHGTPDHGQQYGQQFGHLYGRAPQAGGPGLRGVYSFVLVWLSTALIMWFGTRLLGFERGHLGAAVVSLVVSLAAAVTITVWVRKRGR